MRCCLNEKHWKSTFSSCSNCRRHFSPLLHHFFWCIIILIIYAQKFCIKLEKSVLVLYEFPRCFNIVKSLLQHCHLNRQHTKPYQVSMQIGMAPAAADRVNSLSSSFHSPCLDRGTRKNLTRLSASPSPFISKFSHSSAKIDEERPDCRCDS